MHQIAPFFLKKKSEPPSMNLNPHHYGIYLRVWYVIFDVKKRRASIFFHSESLAYGGYCSKTPLVKCAKVRIWIDLGEKYGT